MSPSSIASVFAFRGRTAFTGMRVLFAACVAWLIPTVASAFNFTISTLNGVTLTPATSLQFGPDHKLYVAQVDGVIKILTIQRVGPNNYQVTATETVDLVRNIPNYDDSGIRNFALTKRQVTGLLVVGTAENPVLYVASSDPRIGGGAGGENDLNLDTNSGVISRLTKSGSTWSKVDLVRGLPRSEENHATNGMQLDPLTNRLLVAQGGNTNAGSPSINFAYMGETALSAAILSVDLTALAALPVRTDAYGQKYVYDVPTLNDPNPSRAHNPDGSDINDPFGGNDGLNQAKLVPGGPVQIYSPGYRNVYDLVITRTPGHEGRLYAFDNGANQGWGGYPYNEGPAGNVTNQYVEGEGGYLNNRDNLHLVTGPGYYAGHPHPLRANPAAAGWLHFDNTQPAGSQMVFSTNPTTDWPAVPVSMANPVEGDFRQPGVDDGALLTYPHSTNGLTEYVATNFTGEMRGNLIAAGYDGVLLRVALSADGTAVTNGVELLASGFGALPLDVTAPDPGHGAPFLGTIWVVHYSPAKISILEPADFDSPGSVTCTGINSFDVDEDGDGFSNADEIANDSDPCSAAIRPADIDGDLVSDLLDQDDDNDGISDSTDFFQRDPLNGRSVPLPVNYNLFNETGIGFYGVGFTGVMVNPGQDYLDRLSPDNVIAGGTAGLFTIAQVGPGSARGGANAQMDAYHFAFNSDQFTSPYIVTARLAGPFFNNTPTAHQTQGIYLGRGDQDNYVSVAVHANDGSGGLEVVFESGGESVSAQMYPLDGLTDLSTLDLTFTVDPVAGTVQPGYLVPGAPAIVPLGSPIVTNGEVLSSLMGQYPLAIGAFANTGGGGTPTFAATWDFFDLSPLPGSAIARITIDPSGANMATSSVYNTSAFKIQNLSTGGQHIEDVTFDLSTAIFPDNVFDTTGTAGDPVAKPFDPDTATTDVTLISGLVTQPHNGVDGQDGYDGLDVTFSSFIPNGTFTFSIDVDPTSVKGAAQPGPGDSASVSGLELIGSTVSVFFSDGSVHRTRLGRIEGSVDGAYGWLRSDKPPKPGIQIVGKTSPLQTGTAEIIRVSGPAGFNVSLVTVEGALYTAGVPGGGYDLDPYEANTAVKVTEAAGTLPASGFADFTVTPTKTNAEAGLNFITATLSDGTGVKGPASDRLVLWYDPTFSGGDSQPPTAPGNLSTHNLTSRSVMLSWAASTDNVEVIAYDIVRNGLLVSTVVGLNYTDSGLDGGVTYNYSVVARDETGNVSPAATLPVTTPANGTVVLRVNAGGPAFVDTLGNTWAADQGFNTGTTASTTQAIDRTVDDALFKTDRVDTSTSAPDLIYSFTVPNGDYEVQLYFAEFNTANAAVGKRLFDVSLEGQLVFDNFDIFAVAGAPYTAVVATATTAVTDGQLNIAFGRNKLNPKIGAIKVIKLPPSETVAPTTPENFNATSVTASSVTLAWNASTDNVGVTGYVVARNGTAIQTTPDLSLTDSGLSASTAYTYSVRAIDAAGNLSPPATLDVTTLEPVPDTEAPTAPGALAFSQIGASSLTVTWSAATDNVGVTGYRISRDGAVLATITGLTFADANLAPSTSYNYAVEAVDAAANASPASTGEATTTAEPALATIRVNAGGASYTDGSGNVWAADTGFNTGKVYSNTATVTGTANPTLFKTERFDEAVAPELLYTFTVPNGSYLVRLHFAETYAATKVAGARVFDIDLQNIRTFEDVDVFSLAGGGNRALVLQAPVTASTGQITIRFIHQIENPKVNAIEILPNPSTDDTQPPTPPTDLAATAVTPTSATLTWSAATDNVGVTGYRISRDGVLLHTATSPGFTDPALTAQTAYTYSVVAIDAAGNASPAATLDVTTPAATDTQAPTAPGALTFSGVTATSVTVNWSAATDDVGVTGYRISRDGAVLTTVTTLSFADSSVTPATGYTYAVVAVDAAGNVSPESSASVTTPAPDPDTVAPTPPGPLTFSNVTANSVTLNWSAATDNVGVTGYRISRDGAVIATVIALTYDDAPLSAATSYAYSVVALDAAGNVSPASAATVATASGGALPTLRINSGGPAYVDLAGNTWAADYGFNTGKPSTESVTVTGTTTPQLYKTVRFDETTNPELIYTFTVPNGAYLIRLFFAETSGVNKAPGKRIFDVDVQGQRAFDDVDIFVLAGGGNKAVMLQKAATVVNGQITIKFLHQVNNPRINAIEIVPDTTDSQPPSAPTGVTAGNLTTTSVDLSWTASTDNVGVTGYEVRRDGATLATVTNPNFNDADLAPDTTYSYTIVARDAAGLTAVSEPFSVTTPPEIALRVNTGGPAFVDADAHVWTADYGFNTGKSSNENVTVTGTSTPTLFKTVRFDEIASPELTYTFDVPNGSYLVRLHFAETNGANKAPGKRVFDVEVQSQPVFDRVDIFAMAGGGNKALVLETPATVTNGHLGLRFVHRVNNPRINAIEVLSSPGN